MGRVLDILYKSRVFDTDLSEDRRVLTFTESCDSYFYANLTKADVIALIMELLDIARIMIPTSVKEGSDG